MSNNKYLFELLRCTWNDDHIGQVRAGGEFARRYDQSALFLLIELLPYFHDCANVGYLRSVVVACATIFHGTSLPSGTQESTNKEFLSYLDRKCPQRHNGHDNYKASPEVLDQATPFFEDFFQVMSLLETEFPRIAVRYTLRSRNKREAVEGKDGLRLESAIRFRDVVRECVWNEGSSDLEETLYVQHVPDTGSLRDHMERVDRTVNPGKLYAYLVGLGVDKYTAGILKTLANNQAIKE